MRANVTTKARRGLREHGVNPDAVLMREDTSDASLRDYNRASQAAAEVGPDAPAARGK